MHQDEAVHASGFALKKQGAQRIQGTEICPTHGEYAFQAYKMGTSIVGKTCPTCLHERQVGVAAQRAERAAREREQERLARLRRCGIAPIFEGATLDNYQVKPGNGSSLNLKTAQKYVSNFSRVLATPGAPGMLMLGMPGTGKTHLGSAMVAAVIDSGFTAQYAAIPTLLMLMKEGARFGSERSSSHVINALVESHLLVLDEYGAHTSSAVDYQGLFTLVDARYRNNLPTILISNLTERELFEDLDQRLIERIKGTGGPTLIFDWGSFRSQPRRETRTS